ncbi:arsenate reductase [Phaeobacter inhibens]|uniref:arsenate reductase family protein n=1 Tax=Phaeobacter inhibens TaxID=221822 RepID=UPI0021A52249|nr:ArsC/Spx/MgsR family protein [Phaeobacter inhibens]UWR83080.1 arsenate reductase [Phaeobacter inhibens]
MQLFGLKACDTCRKALKQLPEAELVDVRADGVPEAILTAALAQFGERLVNTRSTTWRGLSEAERAEDPMALLKAHPALMKRPLIKSGDDLYLGWDAKTKAALGVEG